MANEELTWNEQGLIPGPYETYEEYNKRALFCLNLIHELENQTDVQFPFKKNDNGSQEILRKAFEKTQRLYGISPGWTPLFFCNKGLSPWHGGCAWIFQLTKDSPISALLQIRSQFRHSPSYLGLYQRNELIGHEIAHVGRMMYDCPKFEEILAYQTSASPWRKWLGPIIQSSKESMGFILLLGLIISIDLISLFSDHPKLYSQFMWLKTLPLLMILIAWVRLARRQTIFKKCLKKLQNIYHNQETAHHLIYRLDDKEIETFAKLSEEKICSYILKQRDLNFRWQWIYIHYPFQKRINTIPP